MSEIAIGVRGRAGAAFNPATIALILAIGIVGFVGSLVLGAYAPELRGGGNGGAHALSNAAVGYSGIVRLAAATGRNPQILRSEHQWDGEDLIVAAPERANVNVGPLISRRVAKPTLLILPKWNTAANPNHAGWVLLRGLLPKFEPQGVLAPAQDLTIARRRSGGAPLVTAPDLPASIRFSAPGALQVITDYSADKDRPDDGAVAPDGTRVSAREPVFTPLITDGHGGTVLAQLDNLYILADPDLLDNGGLRSRRNAAAALALLDWLNSNGAHSIQFDVTLNGLGKTPNLFQLPFDPPFLAMTLAFAAMVLLTGWHAIGRFGAPRLRTRAIAFGKTALVDNSAALVRKAGRAHRLGGRYAALIRDRAVRGFGISPRLRGAELDAYLDALDGHRRFTELADAAEAAHDNIRLLAAARALHEWQREKLSDD